MILARHVLAGLAACCLSTPAAAQSGSALLITPRELNAQLRDPNLVLLHLGPADDYNARHIAGSQHIDMQDVAAPRTEGSLSLELPEPTELRQRLEKFGISDNSRIVVTFGQEWISPATRIIWTLQAAGLGDRTRLLDGGVAEWVRAGFPVTSEPTPAPRAGRLTLAGDRSIRVDHAFVQAHAPGPGLRLIDARVPMFYDGPGMDDGRGMHHDAGHIPGAKNIPFNSLWSDSGRYLPVEELRNRFAAAGVQPGDTITAYCHVGQQATAVLFAARLLGHPIRLYDGSMDDWERRKLPLENAKQPAPTALRPGPAR